MRARPFTNFLLINWKVGLEAVVLNEKEVRKLLIPDSAVRLVKFKSLSLSGFILDLV